MASILSSLTQAGQTAAVQTDSGGIVYGTWHGGNSGVTVGNTTYYPK